MPRIEYNGRFQFFKNNWFQRLLALYKDFERVVNDLHVLVRDSRSTASLFFRPRSVPLPAKLQALDPEIDICSALDTVNALVADGDHVDWAVLRDTVRWTNL